MNNGNRENRMKKGRPTTLSALPPVQLALPSSSVGPWFLMFFEHFELRKKFIPQRAGFFSTNDRKLK